MDISVAVKALGALSQESRLKAFRLLVRSGDEGMAAGRIADALSIPHNTLSTHLSTLVNAGLVNSRRESRSIIYSGHPRAVHLPDGRVLPGQSRGLSAGAGKPAATLLRLNQT
jgi:DNA-binding transcriptional ArsR family regulator